MITSVPTSPIEPQNAGSVDVAIPPTRPPTADGIWSPREWTFANPAGTGIELWTAVSWVNWAQMVTPPPSTLLFTFWELVVQCQNESYTLRFDAFPGQRLSIPHNTAKLRICLAAANDGQDFEDLVGWTSRWQWAASPGMGAAGPTRSYWTSFRGPVASLATGARSEIPRGAKTISVKVGGVPLSTIQLREYLASDRATVLATEAVTNPEILLTGLGNEVATINGSGSAINVTYVWGMFF